MSLWIQNNVISAYLSGCKSSAAQRFALADFGRAEILFGSRKNFTQEKGFKNAQNPTCRVHAVLATILAKRYAFVLITPKGYLQDKVIEVEENFFV
jgi:hypothetical protein